MGRNAVCDDDGLGDLPRFPFLRPSSILSVILSVVSCECSANPTATKVFYSQASDDPWQGAGLQVSLGPLQPEFTANCSLCGHCGDLHAPSDSDPPNLTRQRAVEAAFIDDWLRSS